MLLLDMDIGEELRVQSSKKDVLMDNDGWAEGWEAECVSKMLDNASDESAWVEQGSIFAAPKENAFKSNEGGSGVDGKE
jgi:hypothetical protein